MSDETSVAEATTTTAAQPDLTPEELIAAMESSFRDFKDGDIVEGDVVKIDRDEVLLDIGYKSEGVIPAKELSIRHDVKPAEVVQVGEHMEALVLQKEDKEGRLILSKKRAQYERAWGKIEETMRSGQTIKGPVIEVVKGGLILDIGLRGFLPASLVDLRRVRDLQPFVGQELEAKIIELDRNRNNVVLSRRAFLEESQSEGRKTFLQNLQKGERRKGTVSSIVNFGAFVDLGGVDGLVHVSELSWKHVDHPQEVVTVGQEVEVEVLDVDLERERVSLSLKATQEDPWKEFERKYAGRRGHRRPGDEARAVRRVRPRRAGDRGPGPHLRARHEHVDAPESVLSVGQEVQVKVIDVDVSRRRVSLSMRQVTAAPPKPKEIEVEPEVERDAGPEMTTTIEVPAEILAAVAAAEEAAPAAPAAPASPAAPEPVAVAEPEAAAPAPEPEPAPEPVAVAEPEPVAAAEPEPVAAAEPEPEAEPVAAAEPEAVGAAPEPEAEAAPQAPKADEPAAEEEVSLEAILQDLKRREGRDE